MSGELLEANVRLSDVLSVGANEYAAAVWCVSQLFLRSRSRSRILQRGDEFGEVVRQTAGFQVRSVDELALEQRHSVTAAAHGLFRSWPDGLLNFCKERGISAEHFSQDRGVLPQWFEEEIRMALRKQVRGLVQADIEAMQGAMLESGVRVSKTSVAAAMGVNSSTILDEMFQKRKQATEAELLAFLAALDSFQAERMQRRSSEEIRARDVVLVLLSMLTRRTFESVAVLDFDCACDEIRQGTTSRANVQGGQRAASDCLLRSAKKYLAFRHHLSPKRHVPPGEPFFLALRGGTCPARSARQALVACMARMDPRLVRSVEVFAVPAAAIGACGSDGATFPLGAQGDH